MLDNSSPLAVVRLTLQWRSLWLHVNLTYDRDLSSGIENLFSNTSVGNSSLIWKLGHSRYSSIAQRWFQRMYIALEDLARKYIKWTAHWFQWELCNPSFPLWWCCRRIFPQITADRWNSETHGEHLIIRGLFKRNGIVQSDKPLCILWNKKLCKVDLMSKQFQYSGPVIHSNQ